MQDDTSNPGVPFACGLTLEKLSAHTVDEDGNQAFVKDNPLTLLRKVSKLTHLADNTAQKPASCIELLQQLHRSTWLTAQDLHL